MTLGQTLFLSYVQHKRERTDGRKEGRTRVNLNPPLSGGTKMDCAFTVTIQIAVTWYLKNN
jgi:hypothetical protein